jgi:hypothetical protein
LWTLTVALSLHATSTRTSQRSSSDDVPGALVPADALALAEQFDEAAPERLRKWCRAASRKKEVRDDPRLETAAALVDRAFPRASGEARGAVTFLLLYTLYQEQSQLEAALEARIRELAPPAVNAEHRQAPGPRRTLDARFGPGNITPLVDRMRQEEEEERAEVERSRLRLEQRQKRDELGRVQGRIAVVLRILAATHERAKQLSPSLLRSFDRTE